MTGFTGSSVEWITVEFDLSAYNGDILIGFRYMTDWIYSTDGWYVDNVYIDDILISDGSSIDQFIGLNDLLGIPYDFTVTLIGERIRKGKPQYQVMTIMTDGHMEEFEAIRGLLENSKYAILLVTYDAPEGDTEYMGYTIEKYNKGGIPIKK
ncbi:MAG TPA: hypothetical protein G4O15_11005 [Dehalococcoidia bacterium]|nr:hypothetical protein [Dehalococcoidia bacterium]